MSSRQVVQQVGLTDIGHAKRTFFAKKPLWQRSLLIQVDLEKSVVTETKSMYEYIIFHGLYIDGALIVYQMWQQIEMDWLTRSFLVTTFHHSASVQRPIWTTSTVYTVNIDFCEHRCKQGNGLHNLCWNKSLACTNKPEASKATCSCQTKFNNFERVMRNCRCWYHTIKNLQHSPANWALHKSTLLIHSGDILRVKCILLIIKIHIIHLPQHKISQDIKGWFWGLNSKDTVQVLILNLDTTATHTQIKNTNTDGWVRGCWINNAKAWSFVGTHIVGEMSIPCLFFLQRGIPHHSFAMRKAWLPNDRILLLKSEISFSYAPSYLLHNFHQDFFLNLQVSPNISPNFWRVSEPLTLHGQTLSDAASQSLWIKTARTNIRSSSWSPSDFSAHRCACPKRFEMQKLLVRILVPMFVPETVKQPHLLQNGIC